MFLVVTGHQLRHGEDECLGSVISFPWASRWTGWGADDPFCLITSQMYDWGRAARRDQSGAGPLFETQWGTPNGVSSRGEA